MELPLTIFLFWDRALLCTLGWRGTCYAVQAVFDLEMVLLPSFLSAEDTAWATTLSLVGNFSVVLCHAFSRGARSLSSSQRYWLLFKVWIASFLIGRERSFKKISLTIKRSTPWILSLQIGDCIVKTVFRGKVDKFLSFFLRLVEGQSVSMMEKFSLRPLLLGF